MVTGAYRLGMVTGAYRLGMVTGAYICNFIGMDLSIIQCKYIECDNCASKSSASTGVVLKI